MFWFIMFTFQGKQSTRVIQAVERRRGGPCCGPRWNSKCLLVAPRSQPAHRSKNLSKEIEMEGVFDAKMTILNHDHAVRQIS